jgi:hypothetical protein
VIRLNVNQLSDVNYAWPVEPHEAIQVPGPDLVKTLDRGASILGKIHENARDLAKGQKPVKLEIDRYRLPRPKSFRIKDGKVTIRHLRAGHYRLRWLNAAGEPVSEEQVVVPEGADVDVEFGTP